MKLVVHTLPVAALSPVAGIPSAVYEQGLLRVSRDSGVTRVDLASLNG